jgi:hypothetical protein
MVKLYCHRDIEIAPRLAGATKTSGPQTYLPLRRQGSALIRAVVPKLAEENRVLGQYAKRTQLPEAGYRGGVGEPASRWNTQHSTILSFHHSKPMPIVQNEPNLGQPG